MRNRETIRKLMQRLSNRMTASKIMAVGFAAAIVVGGLLLMLPVCNADGRWLSFVDAMFSACSAVCVTGLMTVVPATQFTMAGKLVLLLLIQAGGFGIIVCAMGAFLVLHRQITVRDRRMIQEGLNLDTMSGLVRALRYVLKGTFVAEGIGAFFYAFQFVPQFGFLRGVWYSVFHAVSAFCNAGIDILGDSSLQGYQANPLVNAVTVALIIASGLGFMVWRDLGQMVLRAVRGECSFVRSVRRLRLGTKLAVCMTAALVFGGAAVIFFLEFRNPDTLGALPVGQKWMAAVFQSVTTRTAGFFTIPQNLFREGTRLLCCVLMFIGGCPGGTAGGVKTTTTAILLLHCRAVLRGRQDTECFHRRIPESGVRTAFSVFTASFLVALAGVFLLVGIEQTGLMSALYEVVSAVGTVGLSTGITPVLSSAGKWLIIVLMYLGRLSPVTLALLLAGRGRSQNGRRLPEERVMIG